MKFSLLTTVSSAAIGAGLALSPFVAAEAGTTSYTVSTNNNAFAALPAPVAGYSVGTASSESLFGSVAIPFFVPGARQTLTSVDISLSGKTQAAGSIKNASTTATVTYQVDYQSFLGLKATTNTPSGFALSLTGSNDPSKTFFNVTPGQTVDISLAKNIATSSSVVTTNLSSFTSATPGNYTVDVVGTGQQREAGPNAINFTLIGSAIGTVGVTYNYTTATQQTTPAPEPASIALLGAGLGGVGVIRRRRKA
ncbi:MAG: hypothetical protein B7Z80_03725 [Rhodospirillales bacterium 20-64-7]|nr:MAG: hypothetical protein B7Z80_03725 [Rhodospirillales bacterium 20-64-7]HQT77117.1 VPLPA-CTERM sorting domain-containing protein [Rhodopila sp.]